MSNEPEEDGDDHPHSMKIFIFVLGMACGAAFLLICQKW